MLIPTPNSGDISLYFHLPFCHKKCDYCHFFVLPNKDTFKTELKEALLKEIEQKRSLFENRNVISIYFGGGTPSLVGPDYINQILQQLKLEKPLNQIEITLEINPENHDFDLLKGFYNTHINRLSMGVQSFDDLLLKKLNRSHTAKDIEHALENIFKAQFKNVSIDLMYDLPNQTLDDWTYTLKKATSFPITHLSLYNLSIEPHTVFYKYKERIKKQMPKKNESVKMFQKAVHIFEDHGFHHYEISAFCKDKCYSKHNVGYWLQREHLGFGPSAFSFYEKCRFQNFPHLKKYSRALNEGKKPISFQEKLDLNAHLRESLALHLRLVEGFDLEKFEKRFGKLDHSLSQTLMTLIDQDLMIREKSHIKLSKKGLLYHDSIASQII